MASNMIDIFWRDKSEPEYTKLVDDRYINV